MNCWGLQKIRAELFNHDLDLLKLVPEGYYTGMDAGTLPQFIADNEPAHELRMDPNIKMTSRQRKATVISSYLQGLLLTGARRNELATLRWQDADFQWKSLTIRHKVEGNRTIPLTPYLEHLIDALARRNEFD